MGIQGLKKVISTNSKFDEHPLSYYRGKRIAIDASTCLYQFLIAIRSGGTMLGLGETSSHLVGFFYRTIRYLESEIKFIYVFDGKPPKMKDFTLGQRTIRRSDAQLLFEKAKIEGDKKAMEKYSKRTLKVTQKHVNDIKKLLDLMKIPYIDAPSEAEAFCAALCKKGIVDAVGSEDMDSLAFGAPILLTNLGSSDQKKMIQEFSLKKILKDLNIDMQQFIDLCILLGCDYSESIKGIGPQKGIQMIKKYGSIEKILKNEVIKDSSQFHFENSREIFNTLSNIEIEDIKMDVDWDNINDDQIVEFLVGEHNFNEERVRKGIERMKNTRKKGGQMTINSWFKVKK